MPKCTKILKLFCCIPTLYINYDSYVNVVFYLLISEFIAFCIKHRMPRKVPKIKDFFEDEEEAEEPKR